MMKELLQKVGDLILTGDNADRYKALVLLRDAIAETQAPLTDSFVQDVPDKCDRIVWRNAYYHLPIKATPHHAPVAEITECAINGQQTVTEIDGRWKFLKYGTKLYTGQQEPFSIEAAQAGLIALYEFQEATGCDTAEQFKKKPKLPMKYRRLAFNAELQHEVEVLAGECDALKLELADTKEVLERRNDEIIVLCDARDRERENYWTIRNALTAECDAESKEVKRLKKKIGQQDLELRAFKAAITKNKKAALATKSVEKCYSQRPIRGAMPGGDTL